METVFFNILETDPQYKYTLESVFKSIYKTDEINVPSWVYDEDHRPEADKMFAELKPLENEMDMKRFRKRIRKEYIKQQNAAKKRGQNLVNPQQFWMDKAPWHNI